MAEHLGEKYFADPRGHYGRWRARGAVQRIDFGDGVERWLILGYEEGRAALADPRLCKDIERLGEVLARKRGRGPGWEPRRAGMGLRHMLNADPPDHTRLRRAVSKAFSARRMGELAPLIAGTTKQLLDAMAERDEVDLLAAFAVPLPVTVICHLLDVDIDDHETFREWTKVLVGTLDPGADPVLAYEGMTAFLRNMLREKRNQPGRDLLSALVTDEDVQLDDDELVGTALLLLVAGHETTVNLIGNGTLALLRERAWWDRLRTEPAGIPAAIEELLRIDGPVSLSTPRFTAAPITLGGITIPEGEVVHVGLAAGNQDPGASHGPHLAFGHGVHFCVGAPLARLEARIAFTALLERFPDLHLAVDESELRWYPNPVIRGLTQLPVRLRRQDVGAATLDTRP